MPSELRSFGPHLKPDEINLPAAIERIGPLVCPDWDGTEREAAAVADDRAAGLAAVADLDPERFEDAEAARRQDILDQAKRQRHALHAPPDPNADPCAICGKPSTRVRTGRPYCDQHGKRQPIPEPFRVLSARATHRDDLEADINPPAQQAATRHWLSDEIENRYTPNPDALRRWDRAWRALVGRLLGGQLPSTDLRWPVGERTRHYRPSIDEWRECLTSPLEARAYLPNRVPVSAPVIFDVAELIEAFALESETGQEPKRPKSSRKSHHPTRNRIAREIKRVIATGETLESINATPVLSNAARFGTSRDTFRQALTQVEEGTVARQTPTSTG